MFQFSNFFDRSKIGDTPWISICREEGKVWEILPRISQFFKSSYFCAEICGEVHPTAHIGPSVFIGKGTTVAPGAVIQGPAWIGEDCEIRPGAYVRENVIIGSKSLIGNSSELKNAMLLHRGQLPHFNYVGDSLLGSGAHLGAGVILSNFKLSGDEIKIRYQDQTYATGLRKMGAIIGDGVEVGCHAVLNPGSVIGARSMIYPGVQWRGVLESDQIVKAKTTYTIHSRRKTS